MNTSSVPVEFSDPVNTRILTVAEDRVQGFKRDPLAEVARMSGVALPEVCERIRAMLRAGTIRRVRQTLMTNFLAEGGLVAWEVAPERLDASFEFLLKEDPFSGHVVIRRTTPGAAGESYRLWTTLKVPPGYSTAKHAEYLRGRIGATRFRVMPALAVFALGVGHMRRRGLAIGSKADRPAEPILPQVVNLSDLEWQVLTALKRELAVEEIGPDPWRARAVEAGVPLATFYEVAEALDRRGFVGRFSTFLEHAKPAADGETVSRFNGLFHWAVPPGREIEGGREVARHHILTHVYWRDGGPEFGNVNIMAVAHGTDREVVMQHKAAIDAHLASVGIPVSYSNVFWGERSEIKPSEISPIEYRAWCRKVGVEAETMRE